MTLADIKGQPGDLGEPAIHVVGRWAAQANDFDVPIENPGQLATLQTIFKRGRDDLDVGSTPTTKIATLLQNSLKAKGYTNKDLETIDIAELDPTGPN
jgi:hypothetical protein